MPASWLHPALAAALLLSVPALAGGDDPIPYPDSGMDSSRRDKPLISEPTPERPVETEVEQQDRERNLAGLDDPNIGLAFELAGGLMLIDSSRGQWVEARPDWGGRFTWEWGRLLADEMLREALFVDVMWLYAGLRDGTQQIYNDTNYHYFAVAPAFELKFGSDSPFGVYLQIGGGLAYQFSSLHYDTRELQVAGIKPLLQYGVGLRGAPRLGSDGPFRISFRLELTRFRRGYMDDTFVGGSVGVAF